MICKYNQLTRADSGEHVGLRPWQLWSRSSPQHLVKSQRPHACDPATRSGDGHVGFSRQTWAQIWWRSHCRAAWMQSQTFARLHAGVTGCLQPGEVPRIVQLLQSLHLRLRNVQLVNGQAAANLKSKARAKRFAAQRLKPCSNSQHAAIWRFAVPCMF